MSYNILNKGVKFQGATKGTIEDLVDTHSTQTVNGLKTITHLTGTHVRVTNDVTALGNISASVNISASAFYGDGANLTNVGAVTEMNTKGENRIVTIGSTTTELDGEALLTFDGATRTLTVGGTESISGQSGSIVFHYGELSGPGNISGSTFWGSGAGLTDIPGSALSIVSGGGIIDSSGLKLDVSVDAIGSLNLADKILIFDADGGDAVKRTTAGDIAGLFDPVVSTFNGQTTHRVVTVGGAETIDGEEKLTFDGSILIVDGDFSGSGYVSASSFVATGGNIVATGEGVVIASGITLDNSLGLAGQGLWDNSGKLDIQTSGSIHTALLSGPRYHLGITGSIAGNGLEYAGGVNSISGLAVELDSNSGLAVSSGGLKTSFAALASATPAVASDNLTFIDSDGDKKCSFNTFLTAIAGANLGVSGSQLTASAGGGTTDIDSLSALGGTGLHQTQDHFMFSDNGTEKKITFSNLEDAIFGNVSGDATIAAGGALTIAANAIEGSMLNSNVAGSGLDYGSNELSVDVSDFMANGVDNRVLTATGTDAMTGEANLTFNGSLLTINGTGSSDRFVIGDTDPAESRLLVSGSNTDYLIQYKQSGNGYPTMFLAGEAHSSFAGVFYNRDTFVNAGAISQGNLPGGNGSHVRMTVRKTSISDNSATDVVTITIPNANHAAAIRVFGLANFDGCTYAQSFSFEGTIARASGTPTDKAFSSVTTTENASITPNFSIAVAGSSNTGANGATQTFTLQFTINTSDGSSSNATFMIELINFNDSGITMAAT